MFSAFGTAVGEGPVLVTLHALLGTLLLITATAAVFRAARLRATPLIALSAVALVAMLVAMLVAWTSGARFVGSSTSGSSLAMALAAAVALFCYVLVLVALSFWQSDQPAGAEVRT